MMFSTDLQSNVRERKLLSIAIGVTKAPFDKSSTQVYFAEIKAYQIWRDRDCVALVNKNIHQLEPNSLYWLG